MRKILFLLLIVLCIGCKDKGSREELDMRCIESLVKGANKTYEEMGIDGGAEYDGENIVYYMYSEFSESEFIENFSDIENLRDKLIVEIRNSLPENKYKDQMIDVLTRKDCHFVYLIICDDNPDLIVSIDISPEELL